MQRWSWHQFIALANRHNLPRLAVFFQSCEAGKLPDRVPSRLSPRNVQNVLSELAARGVVIEQEIAEDFEDTTEYVYRGPYGGHPELESATQAICLAALDEASPERAWSVERVVTKKAWFGVLDVADIEFLDMDIVTHGVKAYPMLPEKEVWVAKRHVPFVPELIDRHIWAVGIKSQHVMTGLIACVGQSRAGTILLNTWKSMHPFLIGHHVVAPAYFAGNGFVTIPRPADLAPAFYRMMCWNIDPDIAAAHIEELGLPWTDEDCPAERDLSDVPVQEHEPDEQRGALVKLQRQHAALKILSAPSPNRITVQLMPEEVDLLNKMHHQLMAGQNRLSTLPIGRAHFAANALVTDLTIQCDMLDDDDDDREDSEIDLIRHSMAVAPDEA